MSKLSVPVLFAGLSLAALPSCTTQAQDHPQKKIFADVSSWPTTAPGDVELKNFAPFRAVYDRTYKQAAGPGAGQQREDRVIISAEETAWDGRRALSITIIDSGNEEYDDTNARVATLFVDREDLRFLFEIGPLPGAAKDYYIGRIEDDSAFISQVTSRPQELKPQQMALPAPGFGPNMFVFASMDLREGLKVNLGPTYSARGNALTSASYGHIVRMDTFTDGSGQKHKSWVLETARNTEGAKVRHIHLIDRPPYYLGSETVNLDTGERTRFAWLRHVDLLAQ